MKKFLPELIFSSAALITSLMMYQSIPAGTELFTIVMVLLSFYYFPYGFFYLNEISFRQIFRRKTYQNISRWRRTGVIMAGVVFWMLTFGITFKVRILPGAAELLIFGLSFGLVMLIVLFLRFFKSKNKDFYKRMIIRSCIFIVLGIFFQATSYLTIIKNLYSDNEYFMEVFREYEKNPTEYNKLRLEDELIHHEE